MTCPILSQQPKHLPMLCLVEPTDISTLWSFGVRTLSRSFTSKELKFRTCLPPGVQVPVLQLYPTMCCAVLSRSVLSDSLRPHGLQPARLLCPWGFSRQEYWSGLLCPPPGDLPYRGIESGSSALQANSLPAELPGKPIFNDVQFQFMENDASKELGK